MDSTLFAILKLSLLKAAILFPASKLYRLRTVGYPPIQNLAPMSYASTEARHTHTALKETVFRLKRPEELPASFELGVHIQGRRKNHRSEARQLPPGA